MLKNIFTALILVRFAATPVHSQQQQPSQQQQQPQQQQQQQQTAMGGIVGQIIVPDPHFGERIEIIVERNGELGQTFQVIWTDSTGRFSISGIPVASYILVIKLDGYKEVRE